MTQGGHIFSTKTVVKSYMIENSDINEWYNLADQKDFQIIKDELKQWLPQNQGISLKPIDNK